MTPEVIRGPRWTPTSRGFYVPAGTRDESLPSQRIVEAGACLPGIAAITGWAAVHLLAPTVADGLDPWTGELMAVQVAVAALGGRRNTPHIRYRRRPDLTMDEAFLRRIAATDPVSGLTRPVPVPVLPTAVAVCDELGIRQLPAAVAFCDAVLRAGQVTTLALSEEIGRRAGHPGVRHLRRVLDLSDPEAVNPWESTLRVFYVDVVGLPRPRVNAPIYTSSGRLVAFADLLDEQAGLVWEFDGRGHRDREQHRADNEREELLESMNLVVGRADSLDLRRHRRRLADRMRRAYARGMARDRARDTWRTGPSPAWRRPA